MLARDLAAHLDDALANDAGFWEPFRVFYFKPFPDEFYREIVANLPDDELFVSFVHDDAMRQDGTSTRSVLARENATPFWQRLFYVLESESVKAIIQRHVGFAGRVNVFARLFRDASGYKIAPHTDSRKKACTVQFYLPADDSQIEMGTSFYDRRESGVFIAAHTLQFLPNTGYCFAVSDRSFHGVERKPFAKPRNSLIMNYYKMGDDNEEHSKN